MANIFRDITDRIRYDYQEWRTDWITRWNLRKEMKRIDNAIRRAKAYHEKDNRTYYVLRDRSGAINALNSSDINMATRMGFLPRMNFIQRLEASIYIVSKSHTYLKQFQKIQNSRKKHHNTKDNE